MIQKRLRKIKHTVLIIIAESIFNTKSHQTFPVQKPNLNNKNLRIDNSTRANSSSKINVIHVICVNRTLRFQHHDGFLHYPAPLLLLWRREAMGMVRPSSPADAQYKAWIRCFDALLLVTFHLLSLWKRCVRLEVDQSKTSYYITDRLFLDCCKFRLSCFGRLFISILGCIKPVDYLSRPNISDVTDVIETWGYSLVGYVAGGFPGLEAINKLRGTWKIPHKFSIDKSGCLVFRFDKEEDKEQILEG
ncbi:hypothetical protein M9H77_22825 [Catharanthus roseus]|uniref:Uncharacterized protein n=1 Tax=Catharanthus roseus TaxID=4058 RepID=A0ACC0AST3_CATRO|nr:hypothetical protein M9H77_22825 [Catharanthus roseus]